MVEADVEAEADAEVEAKATLNLNLDLNLEPILILEAYVQVVGTASEGNTDDNTYLLERAMHLRALTVIMASLSFY